MKKHGNSTIVDGFTLEMVLVDKVPSPFSLKDFISYLDQTYCTENLAFYQAVTEYRTTSQFFFGPAASTATRRDGMHHQEDDKQKEQVKSTLPLPTAVRLMNGQLFAFQKDQYHLLAPEEQSCFDYMVMQFDKIIDQFIQVNANQEINIPADMRQQLLINANYHHCYHPSLLAPACSSILELLRISAFIPFITDPQRLTLLPIPTTTAHNNQPAFSLPSSSFSNVTFASTSSSTSSPTSTTSLSSSSLASSASFSSPTVQRPSYFYRSSSHPIQSLPPPPSIIPSTPLPPSTTTPWTLRRLKSSPSLNTASPSSPVPPLPSHPTPQPSVSTSVTCRSSREGDVTSLLLVPHRPTSTHSQSDSTTEANELKPFLKKWACSFRRSPSPQNRPGGWRQINVHDSPLFKQSCLVHHRPS